MPVRKFSSGAPDAMNADEVNNPLGTFIRQAAGESSGQWIQWLNSIDQKGSDITGLPFLTPSKVQMQKCEKCSLEFCSPINYKRHIRLHRRSANFDKESRKYRDLLGAFWDKLSVDEVTGVVSLQDISLKEIAGPSLVHALSTALGKPGFWNLPRVYVKAGSKLLEVIQAKPSKLPVTAQELFSILDDASEGTFLCAGTAESVQNHVFDGEAAKIGFDSMNLIACASFLFEQKLVKAWSADKDAEALRCQKSLFEEEEAAKKKQAGKLEKKKLKKLRQKEQKVRVQLNEEEVNREVPADLFKVPSPEVSSLPAPSRELLNEPEGNLEVPADSFQFPSPEVSSLPAPSRELLNEQEGNLEVPADSLEVPLPEVSSLPAPSRELSNEKEGNLEVPADSSEVPVPEVSSLPAPSDSYSNNPDVSLEISTHRELVQFSSNEDMSVESQYDHCHQHLDVVKSQNVEPQPVSVNSRRRSPDAQWQAPKSQKFGRSGFHNNQNHQALKGEPIQKHKDSGGPVISNKIWTRKVRAESDETSIPEVPKEALDQKRINHELMIGSLSIPVKDCSTQSGEARDDFGSAEPAMPKQYDIIWNPHDAFQIGSNRAAALIWRPVRHEGGKQDPEDGVMSSKLDDQTSLDEKCLQSCPLDSSGSSENYQVPVGNELQGLGWSTATAKAFLAQRWREALAGDHVVLTLSPGTESSGQPDVPNSSSEAAPASDSGEHGIDPRADDQPTTNEVLNSSSSGNTNVKFRRKPEKGIKMKYIPKQKK